MIGAILCYFSNMYTLFVGRFLVGLGVGVESMVVPVLLSEIAPDAERGKFTTLHQLQVTIGICASSIVGYGLVNYVDSGWKYLQLAILVPCGMLTPATHLSLPTLIIIIDDLYSCSNHMCLTDTRVTTMVIT
jgi:MFS family permease